MIQELLGGRSSGLLGGSERKNNSIAGVVLQSSPSPSPSPLPCSSAPTTTTTGGTTPVTASENQNLRCPRCDSSNTKFCYYNNYNLTQPRHFCKTCRRYWTKGGALRNVPIGGGCRKNKPSTGIATTTTVTSVSDSFAKASSAGKFIKTVSSEIGKPPAGPQSSILWATSLPQTSHLLALLRGASAQNPNSVEEVMFGSHMATAEPVGAPGGRTLGLDSIGQVGLCSSFWRSNSSQFQNQNQAHHQQQEQQNTNGFVLGEVQNTGIQDHQFYQRLRSSPNYYYSHDDQNNISSPVVFGNVGSSSNNILKSFPVLAGGELGYWNPSLSWSDPPATANGNSTPYP